MHRRFALVALAVAIVAPVALYLPALQFGFLYDDRPLLIDNPVVASPQSFGEIFTSDLDPQARQNEAPTTNYLRPLFLALAAGLHDLFGDRPAGWHAAAILLHGLLAGLAFALLRGEGIGPLSALGGALLFAFHPSHAQSVAWISGLQDLLFGVTALGAFWAYRRSSRLPWPNGLWLAAAGLAFAVALLAKEPSIGLWLFAAGETLRWIPPAHDDAGEPCTRRPWAELAVLTVVLAAYFAYRWSVLGELAHRFPTAPAMPEALASVPVALSAYARDLFWPVGLFLLHPARPVSSWFGADSLVAFSGLLLLATAAGFALVRRRELARPMGWLLAWLAPVLALWAVNPEWMVMDRYLLLPSLALGWGLALLLPLERGRRRLRTLLWAAAIAAFGLLSFAATRPFASEATFWQRAIAADPQSSTAWAEQGRLLADTGDLEGAAEALARAVALDPQAQLPRLRQALLALRRGDGAAAIRGLAELVERNPGYLPAWRNLVVARARTGDVAGAWESLELALARFPADPLLWTQRAILLRQAGQIEEALVAVRRAAALQPTDAGTALREAALLAELGRRDEARRAAQRGLELSPSPEVRAALEPLAR